MSVTQKIHSIRDKENKTKDKKLNNQQPLYTVKKILHTTSRTGDYKE